MADAGAGDAPGFIQHARQRLTSLTRLQQASNGVSTPAWQEIQRALDAQQNDLLRAAFALELLELVEPAVARAAHLRECVVASSSSEDADRYLDEATRCYFFGLFTACAVMCRSVLEEAIKQKLPASLVSSRSHPLPQRRHAGQSAPRGEQQSSAHRHRRRFSPRRQPGERHRQKRPSTRGCSRKMKPGSASRTPARRCNFCWAVSET